MGRVDIYPITALQGPPSAQLAYAEVTANQTGISAETDLTGLTVTITVPVGRRLRITGQARVDAVTTGGHVIGRIKEGATELTRWLNEDIGAAQAATSNDYAIITPTAGTHTYKLTLEKFNGGNTVTVVAGSTQPAFILVEDITGTFWNGVPVTNPPTVRVTKSAGQNITNSTDTAITWDTEAWDTDTMHSTSSNTSRLTATTAGKYSFTFQTDWDRNVSNTRAAFIVKNNNAASPVALGNIRLASGIQSNGGTDKEISVSGTVALAAGEYIEAYVFQDSGGTRVFGAGNSALASFEMTWLAP